MSRKLTLEELKYIQDEIKIKGKKTYLAYIFAIPFGLLGVHMAYLEKRSAAIVRISLTFAIAILTFLMVGATNELSVNDLTMQLQQYSSALLVAIIGTSVIQATSLIFDFMSIPKVVKEINAKIESESGVKVIQAEYAESVIREEQLPKKLIDETTAKIYPGIKQDINNMVNSKVNDEISEVANQIDFRSKLRDEELTELANELKIESKSISEGITQVNNEIELFKNKKEMAINDLEEVFKSTKNLIQEDIVKFEHLIENSKRRIGEEMISLDNKNQEYKDILEKIDKMNDDEKSFMRKSVFVKSERIKFKKETYPISNELDNSGETIDVKINEDDLFITKNNKETTVVGYITGQIHNNIPILEPKFGSDINILVAKEKNEKDLNKMIVIQLSSRSGLRREVGLKSNPNNYLKKVKFEGKEFKYYNKKGLKRVKYFSEY